MLHVEILNWQKGVFVKPELSIKIDYLKNRQNPAEVFEAMALYINAYRDFGQVLINSVGVREDFDFQLADIEKSSILSKLSSIPGRVDEIFETALYNAGDHLFKELADVELTESEEDVESLAVNLESVLANDLPQQIADPSIDRQKLAFVLEKLSIANQKIKSDEFVVITSNVSKIKPAVLNTKWRFCGKPREMFLGDTKTEEFDDKLYVISSLKTSESYSMETYQNLIVSLAETRPLLAFKLSSIDIFPSLVRQQEKYKAKLPFMLDENQFTPEIEKIANNLNEDAVSQLVNELNRLILLVSFKCGFLKFLYFYVAIKLYKKPKLALSKEEKDDIESAMTELLVAYAQQQAKT